MGEFLMRSGKLQKSASRIQLFARNHTVLGPCIQVLIRMSSSTSFSPATSEHIPPCSPNSSPVSLHTSTCPSTHEALSQHAQPAPLSDLLPFFSLLP
mmetsp:Transcript_421/g.1367  ORF Transcript_421/g.1367 Transcript_421/m.1367 type:complete len:97 (-) Transcript_421:231-521(-)